ncbi:UNVERIFIED_CONTAM: hypothetical protein K2H54_073163 [Gekko kuhli]
MASESEENINPGAPVTYAAMTNALSTALSAMEKSILENISSLIKPLYSQMEDMQKTLNDTRVQAERAVNTSIENKTDIQQLQQLEDILAEKAIRTDMSLRQNNLKIRGLDEAVGKKDDLTNEIKQWLITEIKPAGDISPVITKAYRAGPVAILKTRPSRDVIVTFMDLRYKKQVLTHARIKGHLMFKKDKLEIFPDLPKEALIKRRELKPEDGLKVLDATDKITPMELAKQNLKRKIRSSTPSPPRPGNRHEDIA